ncbi:MAG: hypothetical protein ABID09_00960 [Candidatus Omnitrophota bacterium]
MNGSIFTISKSVRYLKNRTFFPLLAVIAIILSSSPGYCRDTQDIIGEVTKTYTGGESSVNSLLAGFSLSGIIGGILFGSVGFVAFIYGKKTSGLKPMIMGILLMVYPYFVKDTIALYLVGAVLTVALFIWRE